MEERRTRSGVSGAMVEGQSGISSPHKRLKLSEVRPPPNALSILGPRMMRSSSSCTSSPARSRPSTCARPRRRGPLPSPPTAYAVPPPTVETSPLKPAIPVEGTKPSLTMPGTRPMSQRSPIRTRSDLPHAHSKANSKLTTEPCTVPRWTGCTVTSIGSGW